MNTRKPGFYPIRFDCQWTVGFWSGYKWYRIGYRTPLTDRHIDEILEERIKLPVYVEEETT